MPGPVGLVDGIHQVRFGLPDILIRPRTPRITPHGLDRRHRRGHRRARSLSRVTRPGSRADASRRHHVAGTVSASDHRRSRQPRRLRFLIGIAPGKFLVGLRYPHLARRVRGRPRRRHPGGVHQLQLRLVGLQLRLARLGLCLGRLLRREGVTLLLLDGLTLLLRQPALFFLLLPGQFLLLTGLFLLLPQELPRGWGRLRGQARVRRLAAGVCRTRQGALGHHPGDRAARHAAQGRAREHVGDEVVRGPHRRVHRLQGGVLRQGLRCALRSLFQGLSRPTLEHIFDA